MNSSSPITHEEIAERAHDIWEQSGRPESQETDHWLRAERELQKERGQAKQFERGSGQKESRETNRSRAPGR